MTEPFAMASAAVMQVGAANMRAFLNYMKDLTSGGRKTTYGTLIHGSDGENTIIRDEQAKLRIPSTQEEETDTRLKTFSKSSQNQRAPILSRTWIRLKRERGRDRG